MPPATVSRLRQPGLGIAACSAILVASTPPVSAQTGKANTLQVAAWNLSHLTKEQAAELKVKPAPTQRKWRNTFGAERRTPAKRNRHGIDADVVALQGLRTVSEVRGVFPAATHQVIVSRAALGELQGEIPGSRDSNQAGFTAIAIRSRAGIRITGQHYFTAPSLGPSLAGQTTSTIALRLTVDRSAIWLFRSNSDPDCSATASDNNPGCDGQRLMSDTISRWIERTRAAGTPVILAGHIDQLEGSVRWPKNE